MPEKHIALQSHKSFVAGLHQIAPTCATVLKNHKGMRVPPGVQGTLAALPKLVQWFEGHGKEYELMAASLVVAAASKPKVAGAGA